MQTLVVLTAGLFLGGVFAWTRPRGFRWLLIVSICLCLLGGRVLWGTSRPLETPIRNPGFSVESWLNLMDTMDSLRANVAREKKVNAILFFASAGLTTAFLMFTRQEAGKHQKNRWHLTSGSTEPGESASVPNRTSEAPGR